jgi:hypothetical protein
MRIRCSGNFGSTLRPISRSSTGEIMPSAWGSVTRILEWSVRPIRRRNRRPQGSDKVVKTNAVADIFFSGAVWAPLRYHFAQRLVED